jgi:hypothetical protein
MEFNQNKNPLRPYQSKYSEDQQKAMSKIANIGAATRNIKSLLNLKKIASKNTEKNTVSLFDYTVELLNMLLGPQYTDGLFMKFLNELMDPEKTYLEEFLIKALAKSLDANGKHLAPIGDVQTDKLSLNSIAITSITLSDGINEPEVFFEGDTLTYDTTARIAERMVYLINNEKEKVTVSASQDNPGVDEYFNLKSQIAGTGYTMVNLVNLSTDPLLAAQNVQMQQQVINNNNATLVYNYTYTETTPTGSTVSNLSGESGQFDITVFVSNNSTMPSFSETYLANEYSLTSQEAIDNLKNEIDNYGFNYNGLFYPKTGTLLSEIQYPLKANLEGSVFLKNTYNPIPSALIVIKKSKIPELTPEQNIILQNESITIKTDEEGNFKVQNLEVNKYDIFTYCDNYKDNSILNFELPNEGISNLEIKLETENTISSGTTTNTIGTTTNISGTTTNNSLANYTFHSLHLPKSISTAVRNNLENNNLPSFILDYTVKDYSSLFQPTLFIDSPLIYSSDNREWNSSVGIYTFKAISSGLDSSIIKVGDKINSNINIEKQINKKIDLIENDINDFMNQFRNFGFFNTDLILYPKFNGVPDFEYGIQEIEKLLKYEADNYGFINNSKSYPKTGTAIDLNGNSLNNNTTNTQPNTPSNSTFETAPVGITSSNLSPTPQPDSNGGFASSFSGLTGLTASISSGFTNDIQNTFHIGFKPEDVGLTNEQYLTKYLLPVLVIGKKALMKQLISMMFGPKEKMSNDSKTQDFLVNSVACSQKMFSVSNDPISDSELEYNRVNLKKQLTDGKVELTISCQKLTISLPENYVEDFGLQDNNITGGNSNSNPANSVLLLSNYIQTEIQRQNTEENSYAVKKSFIQIFVEQFLSIISTSLTVSPEMQQVMELINNDLQKTPSQQPMEIKEMCSSPCEITNACDNKDKENFKKKSAFSSSLIESILSMLISMLIQKLIIEVKKKVKEYIMLKAKQKFEKIKKRQSERHPKAAAIINKTTEYANAYKSSGILGIMQFASQQRAQNNY